MEENVAQPKSGIKIWNKAFFFTKGDYAFEPGKSYSSTEFRRITPHNVRVIGLMNSVPRSQVKLFQRLKMVLDADLPNTHTL